MMPKVSVAVPVYNGAEYLRSSLECIRDQTFRNIEVVMLDNASTDATAEICGEFAKVDRRFRHVRNDETIPVLENFRRAMELTQAPYFMWRADDDRSAPDFIERLAAALDAKPSANLAVCPIRRFTEDGQKPLELPSSDNPSDLLAGCHAPWFYGLWRRRVLPEAFGMIDAYPFTWASDHVAMLPVITRGEVALCHDTEFEQYLRRPANYALDARDRLRARKAYAALAYPLVNGGISRKDIEAHLDRRVAPLWKSRKRMIKQAIKRLMAAPSPSTSNLHW